VNRLRQLMLEELQRRNFADTTIRTYLHGVAHFSRYFRRPPDQESLKKRGVADLILLPGAGQLEIRLRGEVGLRNPLSCLDTSV
jgi:hypothetical protein